MDHKQDDALKVFIDAPYSIDITNVNCVKLHVSIFIIAKKTIWDITF